VSIDYRSADLAARVEEAKVYDVAIRSSLSVAPRLSKRLNNRILLKREDQQPSFSFKVRGATNKVATMNEAQLGAGVICSSAGNHAQGVAIAARRRGAKAVVVMPASTPQIKVDAVRSHGAEVVLHGADYDEAQSAALVRAASDGLAFVHPFDDLDVIAGQGTIGREVLDQVVDGLHAVFVPVGGGGLAAGVATYIKAKRPEVLVFGVEPVESASMKAALEAGAPVTLDHVGTFADGVAVKRIGDVPFEFCQQHLDGVIVVSTDELCAAIRDIFEDTRTIVEPAGALAVAGIARYVEQHGCKGETLVAINCGANMNFERLGHVTERTAIGNQTEVLLAVQIPEQKGSFLNFCNAIGQRQVTEFNYRRSNSERAMVFVGLEVRRDQQNYSNDRSDLISSLQSQNFDVADLTDNEVAKLHIRHLAGGVANDVQHERLYRFEFPERRRALLSFLESVGVDWDITLFHYRNHGSDYGRVLVALDVAPETVERLHRHLDDLGYPYWDEFNNQAFELFMRP